MVTTVAHFRTPRDEQQDLKDALGIKDEKGGLEDAQDRSPIEGTRGVAWQDTDGNVSSTSGAPGETLAPDPTGLNPFPQTSGLVTGDGSLGAEEILDGEVNPGDVLDDFRAIDCETGEDLSLRPNGIKAPGPRFADDGTLLSKRWLDAETPPEVEGFFFGFNFKAQDPSSTAPPQRFASAYEAFNAHVAAHIAANSETLAGLAGVISSVVNSSGYGINATLELVGGGTAGQSFIGNGAACTPDSEDATCPIDTPVETSFPPDDEISLELVDGVWKGSEFDLDQTSSYKSGQSTIDFCFTDSASNDRTGRVTTQADGSLIFQETDAFQGDLLTGSTAVRFAIDNNAQSTTFGKYIKVGAEVAAAVTENSPN